MPTTDTFIIPPMSSAEPSQPTTPAKPKRNIKIPILVILVLLIITLPVGIFYISKQQEQVTETRSQAGETYPCHFNGNATTQAASGCTGKCGPGICDEATCLGKRGTNDNSHCCNWMDANAKACTSSSAGTAVSKDGTFTKYGQNCGYVKNKDLSHEANRPGASCNATNCGGDCGRYVGNCGVYCFDLSCAKEACAAIGEAEKSSASNPTATPTTAATPTPTTGSSSNSGTCDASCENDSNCASGLTCSSVNGINRCRNASCASESSCSCPDATATPAPAEETTGDAMPVSGVGPGIIGSATVIGSLLLLVAGLAL